MKVKIKKLIDVEVKKKAFELEVADNQGKHLGDLAVNQAGITWCNGKERPTPDRRIPWEEFIAWANSRR